MSEPAGRALAPPHHRRPDEGPAAAPAPIARIEAPATPASWAEALDRDRGAMADHTPQWVGAIARTGRWRDASRCYRLADGRTVVLPLVRAGGRAAATTWAASPPSGRGFGGLVGDGAHDPAVVAAVLADLAAQRWLSVRIRPMPTTGDLWARSAPPGARIVPRRAHVLDLSPGPDAVFAGMRKSTRRLVRRHQRDGLEVEVATGPALLERYLQLWRPSVDRWATASHEPLWLARRRALWRDPPERLRPLAEAMGERFRVWIAWRDGHPVAANVMASGPTAHTLRAAMDRDRVGSSGIMQYLDWLAIEQAFADGSHAVCLGESGASAALSSYKEGLGAVGLDYAEVRLERLPVTPVDQHVRAVVKRATGFRD
jgi:hypothetical protein